MRQNLNCKTHKNPPTVKSSPRKWKNGFKKWLQDKRTAERQNPALISDRKKNEQMQIFDFPTGATAATFQSEARRRKHVTPILHTVTTESAAGGQRAARPTVTPHCQPPPTSTSWSWLKLPDCWSSAGPTFNTISSSGRLMSTGVCGTWLTFKVSLFRCSSSHDLIGLKLFC